MVIFFWICPPGNPYSQIKGLITKVYKELIQHHSNKPNNPILKLIEDLNYIFPKKTYQWPTDT